MKEQLVKFETAKLAKEKEFDLVGYTFYQIEGEILVDEIKAAKVNSHYYSMNEPFELCKNHNINPLWCAAPTQALLQKWLREVHKIDIYVIGYGFGYYSQLNNVSPGNQEEVKYVDRRWNMPPDYKNGEYKNYEEALERGLQEALKLI